MLVSDFVICCILIVVLSFAAGYCGRGESNYKLMYSLALSFVGTFAFCATFLIAYLIATYVMG